MVLRVIYVVRHGVSGNSHLLSGDSAVRLHGLLVTLNRRGLGMTLVDRYNIGTQQPDSPIVVVSNTY